MKFRRNNRTWQTGGWTYPRKPLNDVLGVLERDCAVYRTIDSGEDACCSQRDFVPDLVGTIVD